MCLFDNGNNKIDFRIRICNLVIMSSNTYTNAFLAALFSVSDIDVKTNEIPSRMRYIDNRSHTKYPNNTMRRKFNCRNLRKNHTIGQPQWRGYSH